MTLTGLHEEDLSLLPEGDGCLLVEFGGETKEEADARAHALMARREEGAPRPQGMKLYDDPPSEEHVWEVREAGLGATAFIPGKPDTYEGWEDSAVPPERVGDYLRELRQAARRYGYESALYGHFGQGCIHARWNFDLVTRRRASRTFRRFLDEAADLVVSLRRLALRRARRRPVARGAAAEDVRRRARRGRSASSRRSGTRTGR